MSRPNRTYLDTETTGLDPYRNEIIEIAFVVEEVPEDPLVAGRILETWATKIRPSHIGTAHPKALEINGYDPKEWESAPYFVEVSGKIAAYLKNATVLVGHNPGFDAGFLEAAFRREGIDIVLPYHRIDTVTSAFEAWHWTGEGPGLKLDKLRDFLGIPKANTHSALKDALDSRRVLYAARSKLTGVFYDLEPSVG